MHFAPGRAVADILAYIGDTMTGQYELLDTVDCTGLVPEVTLGGPIRLPDTVPGERRHAARAAVWACAVHRQWGISGCKVYAAPRHLLEELAVEPADRRGEVPRDPMIVFPDPPRALTPDGYHSHVLACYLHGRTAARWLCSTHHPRRDTLGMIVVSEIVDSTGRTVDTELTRVTIPSPDCSVADVVQATLSVHHHRIEPADPATDHLHDWLAALAEPTVRVLGHLGELSRRTAS